MTHSFRLLWMTDPHLNFCHEEKIKSLCNKIMKENPSAIVITGDIAEAQNVAFYLTYVDKLLNDICPIFFVLGNHDYYNGSIADTRENMRKFFTYDEASKKILEPRLGWLGCSGYIPLTEKTALVGHDGWYDGQYANWFSSRVYLNDYILIRELADRQCPVPNLRFAKINELAKEAADYIKTTAEAAVIDGYKEIYIATHVPPFPENAVYDGKQSDEHWLPHFSSKHMGDNLCELAEANRHIKFVVLCGHSHGHAVFQKRSNLVCYTGKAKYKYPKINEVFEL